jgi:hypothetical protein
MAQMRPASQGGGTSQTSSQLHALKLELVRTPRQRLLYRQMMVQHHYLGYYPMAGAQLRYLLYHDAQLLGGLGFGASAWSLADRDRFIGWSKGCVATFYGNKRCMQ